MRPTDTAITRPLLADEAKLVANYWKMSPWEQERFECLAARLANRDIEAVGLSELFAAGKITRLQLLELI